MHRNVTAMYRTREVADLVRRGLEETGVPARDIHVVPDPTLDTPRDRAVGTSGTMTGMGAGAAPAGTATAGARAGRLHDESTAAGHEYPLHEAGFLDDPAHSDRLHELHLPEDDLRTYQQAVRRGDYVVSVEVEDRDVERVKEIMRRPEEESYRLEDRDTEFGGETVVPHSLGEGHMINEDARARRMTSHYDPFARVYERGAPLQASQRRP
jgi:hypothetical protein